MKWTKDSDRRLLAAVRAGLSIRGAARHLKISENAAIGRWHRIKGFIFQSDIEQRRLALERILERKKVRACREREAIARMEHLLKLGADRSTAVVAARSSGASYRIIGERLGVSRQRVHQIINTAR